MITDIRSSLQNFHRASFGAGLNVVLADTVADSEETESTNGLGKTTLIRIVRFCLGSNITRDRVLSHPELAGTTFGMSFTYDGAVVDVDRRIGDDVVTASRFFCGPSAVDGLPDRSENVTISLDEWKRVLSTRIIAEADKGTRADQAPGIGEFVGYLARVGKAAYSDPLLSFSGQPGPTKRQVVSFLLGLNWQDQKRLHDELQRRSQINAAIKAYVEAQASAEEKSIGDLEAERVVLEKQVLLKREEVSSFNVREDYRELESRLGGIDRGLHDAVNENHSDKRLLEYYERSAQELPAKSEYDPVAILRDAGAIFKAESLRSLKEVSEFHSQIYRNRSEFLQGEITRLRLQIKDRSRFIESLVNDKSELLAVLKSSGALESLIELQRGTRELEAELITLKARIDERKKFDRRKDEINLEIGKLRTLLKQDLEDRRPIVDEAVALFAEYTKSLYGVPGRLVVDIKDSGYSFAFSIDREGSDGVDQMVVFCFDLAVATLRARRDEHFKVLIHDSSMFADVDPRQYGLAIQLSESVSREEGFQYICCLNGGALPVDHLGELDLRSHVRLRLTDDGDHGRLLGKRLAPREH